MNKKMRNSIVVALAVLFISISVVPSNAATLFYLYVPNDAEILKADINVFKNRPVLGVVLGSASIRLVYRRNGKVEKYTIPCYMPNQNPYIPLPINVEMHGANINKPYVEYID